MRRTIHRASPVRSAIIVSISAALVVAFLNFTGDGRGIARAITCLESYDCGHWFAIPNSIYQSTGGTGFAGVPIELVSMSLHGPADPTQSVPLPPPGGSADHTSFFDVFTESILFGNPSVHDAWINLPLTYRITNPNPPGGTGEAFDTEMLSMVLEGHVGPPGAPIPFIIRESPTLASTGKHSVTPLAGGGFGIDSFFDVFTELSLDGGQTFHVAIKPIRLELSRITPEPATITLAMLGVAGILATRARRRVVARS